MSIRQAVFKISCSQAIVNGRTDRQTDGQGHSIIRPVYRLAYKKSVNVEINLTIENRKCKKYKYTVLKTDKSEKMYHIQGFI